MTRKEGERDEVPRGAPGCTCGTPPFAPPEPSNDCPFHAAPVVTGGRGTRKESTLRSQVVLTAQVGDPLGGSTLMTRRTIVNVEHYTDNTLAQVVEMALEIAPSVEDWGR